MHLVAHPSPALAPFVDTLWYVEFGRPAHGLELVLPSGGMQLLVNLADDELRAWDNRGKGPVRRVRGAALDGARAGPVVIDTAEQRAIMGVAFRPGGAHPFFAAPASEAAGELVEFGALWGRDGEVLRERLLEAPTPAAKLRTLDRVLVAQAVRPLATDHAGAFAVAALDHGVAVGAVADRLGMTGKRFARRFTERVGLRPKRFARVRRFQRLLRATFAVEPVDWARLAVECGYYDQAHLIRDFRAFSDMSPGAYHPRSRWERNHVPLEAVSSNRGAPRSPMIGA